jgi:heptosyltransferase-2
MVELNQYSRCLIIAPSWVGDMVMAQSLFKELKAQNSDLVIDVLAPAWCSAITRYMPEVNQLIEAPFSHGALNWKARRKLAKELKKQEYDIAFVLPNSLKSALVPWMAKIPIRVGFLGEQRYGLLNYRYKLDKVILPKMIQRFVALARPSDQPPKDDVPLPRLEISLPKQSSVLKRFALSDTFQEQEQSILALCPGAEFGKSKQWPMEHYAAVARFYLDLNWQVWLFGSQKDYEVCQEINVSTSSKCINFAGETELSDAVVLMSAVNLVVTNDSGLMHVAAALHKPLVAIYGSTDPGFTPPLNSQARVERLGLDCSPCFQRECPLNHMNCLVELKPNQVLSTTKSILALEES